MEPLDSMTVQEFISFLTYKTLCSRRRHRNSARQLNLYPATVRPVILFATSNLTGVSVPGYNKWASRSS